MSNFKVGDIVTIPSEPEIVSAVVKKVDGNTLKLNTILLKQEILISIGKHAVRHARRYQRDQYILDLLANRLYNADFDNIGKDNKSKVEERYDKIVDMIESMISVYDIVK